MTPNWPPRPWRVDGRNLVAADDTIVAVLVAHPFAPTGELLAQAPELFERLDEAKDDLISIEAEARRAGSWRVAHGLIDRLRGLLAKVVGDPKPPRWSISPTCSCGCDTVARGGLWVCPRCGLDHDPRIGP